MNNARQLIFDIMIVLSVPILFVGGYFIWFRDASGPLLSSGYEELKSGENNPGATTKVALQTLNSITLNSSLFTDPSYQSLRTFTVEIPTSELYRKYPFTPTTEIFEMLRRNTSAPAKDATKNVKVESINDKLDLLKKSATR